MSSPVPGKEKKKKKKKGDPKVGQFRFYVFTWTEETERQSHENPC